MACGAAIVTDHKARYIHWLEVRERKTCNALKIIVVPASVGRADQSPAAPVIGKDDSIVSECGDENGRLRTCGGTRGSRHGSLEPINFASGSGHAAAGGRRGLRDFRVHGNGTSSCIRATPHARCLRSRPDPVVQHLAERESDGMLNRTVGSTGCASPDNLVGIDQQWRYRKSRGIGCSYSLRSKII